MSATILSTAFDRATQAIFGILSPEQVHQIVDYHADETLQTRIAELAEKANEGNLSTEERSEYQGYAQANHFVAILQAGVQRKIVSES
jgi:hypothetical protein